MRPPPVSPTVRVRTARRSSRSSPGRSPRTSALGAGLRLSRHRIELPPADRGVGVRLDFGEATGDLGVVRRLGEGLDLVLRLAQGFRPPNVFDLGTLGPRPGNRFNLPNPALGPERILSGDLGLRWRGERFRGELFAYRARYRDKITSVLTGEP
ncbi:MAG: TonB-dependent receptor [Xanthomonadales bacterium]|nr:TonB-dependent receptor [Xanthomonadales bacterium]